MTWHENDDMYDGGLTSQYSVSVVNLTIGQDEIVITKQRLYTWGTCKYTICNNYLPRYHYAEHAVFYIYSNAHTYHHMVLIVRD